MSKIYIEARFQMPVLDTDEFGYDKEEAEKIDWEEFAKDDFWNSCEDMGELENKYDITFHKVQPKLSIPKKIAEEQDGFNPNECETKIELLIVGYYKSFLSDELMSFCLANNGLNLCAFYLAGKALGVELVSIEGD